MTERPSEENGFLQSHIKLLADSYRKFTGKELLPAALLQPHEFARAIFVAPFVVVSHNTLDDPVFNYGNQCALDLFELDWNNFTELPSRKSAEPMNRAERARLLASVTKQNFIDDYSGVRISSTGKRFFLPQATVWSVVDDANTYRGQAATFSEWQFL